MMPIDSEEQKPDTTDGEKLESPVSEKKHLPKP
jgi:hypothetical protein